MTTRALASSLLVAACSVYDASLIADSRPGSVTSGGSTAQAGRDNGGEAGEPSSRGGANTGGRTTTPGGNEGQAGSDMGGGDAGGEGPVSGGTSSGGASSGGTSSGGTSSGGEAATGGAATTGGKASGGTATGGASTGGATSGGASAGGSAGATGGSGGAKGGAAGAGGTLSTGGKSSGGSAGTAGGGAAGILFSDNFEAGAASAWTASTSGDWSVVTDGSRVYRQATVVNSLRVASAGSASWQDQSVQARVKVLAFGGTSASSSYFAALCARYTDENNHYYLALRSDGKISIRRKIEGSNASIGSAITPGQLITTGTWYTVRLEVTGTTLKAYVDGVLYDTVTDTSFSAGKIAVGSSNASVVFDDVVVSAP